jgi:hypothetical protein
VKNMLPSRSAPRTLTLLMVCATSLVLASSVAWADVPTSADIATCNRTAREGLQAGTSPIARDEAGARAARLASAGTVARTDPAGAAASAQGTQSPDAQIHGMDAHGGQDAAYRAAYRVCMRTRGF